MTDRRRNQLVLSRISVSAEITRQIRTCRRGNGRWGATASDASVEDEMAELMGMAELCHLFERMKIADNATAQRHQICLPKVAKGNLKKKSG